jgi:NAD(P)-dependent dehydrogenase (short-subunit alcohol dehydrogenase family)
VGAFFDGDVVVVTGGGKGLGRAYCLELASAGASVVVNDLDEVTADAVVQEIEQADGIAMAAIASVSTPEGARAITAAALDRFGTIDAVVNNAGFMANGMFEEITPEMLEAMLDVHIKGAYFVTQAAWPTMRDKGYGRVVLTCSSGGMFASGGRSNYAAAKAGLYGLCKALAYEGQKSDIAVNALLPFATTGITGGKPLSGHSDGFPPGLVEALAPLRLTQAVAPMVAYLCTRGCAVTGEAFSAGMGHFARVYVGAARGWATDASSVTIAQVAENFEEIRDLEGATVPKWIYDEFAAIADRIGLTYG